MKRSLLLLCCFALAATPVLAGPVYVPLAIRDGGQPYVHVTEVWATNPDDVVQGFVIRYLSSLTDGTTREEGDEVGPFYLMPQETKRFETLVPPGFRGMLELDGSRTMQFSAALTTRLSQTNQKIAEAHLPVLGSDQLAAAGEGLYLQGWERIASNLTTNLGIINFGNVPATCTVGIRQKDGLLVLQGVSLDLPALSHVQFDDAPGLLQLTNVPEGMRSVVSCNQPFWTYATTYDARSGAVELLEPSIAPIDSALVKPSPGAPPPPPPGSGVEFWFPGEVVRYPQSCCGLSNYRVPLPFGGQRTFHRIIMDFDLRLGGFDSHNSSGFHCLFWLNNGQSWANMFGYVNSRGTQGRTVFQVNATGYGWQETTQNGGISPGGNYHVHYEYDTVNHIVFYEITQDGGHVVGKEYDVSYDEIVTNNFFVELGYQYAEEGPEAYTPGWTFSNLRVFFEE